MTRTLVTLGTAAAIGAAALTTPSPATAQAWVAPFIIGTFIAAGVAGAAAASSPYYNYPTYYDAPNCYPGYGYSCLPAAEPYRYVPAEPYSYVPAESYGYVPVESYSYAPADPYAYAPVEPYAYASRPYHRRSGPAYYQGYTRPYYNRAYVRPY